MLYLQEQTNYPPLFEAVGCICYSKGRILLLKRTDEKSYPGRWGIPSGKVKENESRLRAIVRELFEETGMLLSADNLYLVRTYHVITEEMSFLYTVYQCQFESIPEIKIRSEEHTRFVWFKPEEASQLDLVPGLDGCLKDVLPLLKSWPIQLELFPLQPNSKSPSVTLLEQCVKETIPQRSPLNEMKVEKPWYVSFGPPCAGKTTGLKAMSKENENLQFVEYTTILRKRTSRLNFYLRKAFEEDERSLFFHFQIEVLPVRFWQAIGAPAYSLVDDTIYST
jgi:8-oxo-dGTP pyrophosphatase MutT (NUDIX family)